jgi:hypothetical protein
MAKSDYLRGEENYADWAGLVRIQLRAIGIRFDGGKPPALGSLSAEDDDQLAAFLMPSIKKMARIGFRTTESGLEILAGLERRYRGQSMQSQGLQLSKLFSIKLKDKSVDSVMKYIDSFNVTAHQLTLNGDTQSLMIQIAVFLNGVQPVLPGWVRMQQAFQAEGLNTTIEILQSKLMDEVHGLTRVGTIGYDEPMLGSSSMASQQAGRTGQAGRDSRTGRRGRHGRRGREKPGS